MITGSEAAQRRPAGERIHVGAGRALRILWPYVRGKATEQIVSLLPVVASLFLFQIVVLRTAVAQAAGIAVSLAMAILGLMFFMEGLRLWLLPIGESIGDGLPRRSSLGVIIGFAFLVGAGATLAEPAIGALRAAGSGVDPSRAPLLHALLNRYATELAACVAVTVGLAVVIGTLRFLGNWSLKRLLLPILVVLGALTLGAHAVPELREVIGLAWDIGGVIVGPITVPLVLGLGLGVCRSTGRSDAGMAGFGAVALISLAPVLATLVLGIGVHLTGGAALPPDGGSGEGTVGPGFLGTVVVEALASSSQAVLPLCVFLFVVHLFVLRERIARGDEVSLGVVFALIGLALFNVGLMGGLTPLGDQVGNTAPAAFLRIVAGEPPAALGPLYDGPWGLLLVVLFAFVLGYGSTLAEPALQALGIQVHEITVGAIRKGMLVQAVSLGVGAGMAAGVAKVILGWPLAGLLLPAYALILALTFLSSEEFASISWDCGAVTTGPVTVPLVVAMGLGMTKSVPGVADGFGILSLATAGPILFMLAVGLIARRGSRRGAEVS